MKWVYDLCGAEPIIKDLPAFDAATIAHGEAVMLSAAAFSAGGGGGIAVISGASSTVGATQMVDGIGIALETKTTADAPSIASAVNLTTTVGRCMIKTIINPFAIYRAEYAIADAVAVAAQANTSEIQVTGVGASTFDGSWVWFSATAGPNYGQLRFCAISGTAATIDLDVATLNVATTADAVMFINVAQQYSSLLSADALSISQSTVGPRTATNLRVVDVLVDKGAGIERLNYNQHRGTNVGSTQAGLTKFYNDVLIKDHAYGAQEN
jgi:hypothetical protein